MKSFSKVGIWGCLPLAAALLLGGCEGEEASSVQIKNSGKYTVLAWNDLGMHCLNPSYDTAVILPPYNNVWVQVIQRGNKPQIVTSGITVEYKILKNTSSANKGQFGQFWGNAVTLFKGLFPTMADPLPQDQGLTGNKLSGIMKVVNSDHFEVTGIPVVPYEDGSTVRNPYQVAEITVKDSSGNIVATTQTTVPTSDEFNCALCHNRNANPFQDIIDTHNRNVTSVTLVKPVLCASCHGSPVLGQTGRGSSGKYLSEAIHGYHANKTAPTGTAIGCYDCHPGQSTQCNRSLAHKNVTGNCTNTNCHGTTATIADAITSNAKVPWVNEPKCVSCHAGVAEVDTGAVLYRNFKGHGGLYCAGCHGSPHAMYPVDPASSDKTGNYQPIQYQSKAKSLGSCGVCHGNSRGGGSGDFAKKHGGGSSACGICHTGFNDAGNTSKWPHQYQWKAR